MGRTTLQQAIADRQRLHRRALGEELRTAREDAGLSIRETGRAAGLDAAHLSRIEAGEAAPTQDALVAFATVLGRHVSMRLFPTDGPRLRDHLQVRMLDALIAELHPRWHAMLEVAVHRPARGVIDVVLHDTLTNDLVTGEAHSELRSAEQQLRWANEKTDSLPSAGGWPWSDERDPRTGRLLLLRATRTNRALVARTPHLFRAAYPADPGEAMQALTSGAARWPGAALLWVRIDGERSRLTR